MPEVLPELGALAAAAALLLIAAALWVTQGLIKNTFARVPVIGPWVGANIVAALNDARNFVLDGARASWGAAVQLFKWMEAFIRGVSNAEFDALVHVFTFGQRLYDTTLPNLESRVLVDASGWFSSAESYALSLYRSAVSLETSLVDQAIVDASNLFASAEHYAAGLFDTATADIANALITAEHDAANLVADASTTLTADIHAAEVFAADGINALESSTQAAINTLSADITAGIHTAETLAAVNLGAAVGGIYTDLETWGDKAVADAWPDAQGDINALRGTLGADFPWLNDLLGALGGLGAAGLAGALIRSMATSHALTRLADDCIVPQCRNLGGLSNDLGNLLSDASTAAMLAWLIFGVTDPAGWAQETSAVGGPIASGLAQAAGHLFGG